MATATIHFCGFNGFGHFQRSEKVVRTFKDVTAEIIIATSHGSSSKTPLIIFHEWHYIALAVANQLCLSGFLGAQSNQLRHFHFEHSIKSISGTNKLCTVLLENGIAYKIDLGQLQPIELNAVLIKPAAPSNTIRAKSIFGVSNDIGRNVDTEFITHFASGRSFSIAITNKNAVYNVPLRIFEFPAHIKIRKICCGNEHCLILTTNGDLYAFGSSSRGQLGLGTLHSEERPVLVDALAGIKIIDIAAGGWHSLAISAFNDLYAWGWNVRGQLGLPLYKPHESHDSEHGDQSKCASVIAQPVSVDLPKHSRETLDINSTAVCADENEDFLDSQYSPVAVSAGANHSIVQTADGPLLGAGWNKYGQLAGELAEEIQPKFTVIAADFGDSYRIICGNWSTIVIKK